MIRSAPKIHDVEEFNSILFLSLLASYSRNHSIMATCLDNRYKSVFGQINLRLSRNMSLGPIHNVVTDSQISPL